MTIGTDEDAWAFLRAERVSEAVAELRDLTIPSFFIAYLHYRERAIKQQSLTAIRWDWTLIRPALTLPGGSERKPHFRPFNEPGRGSSNWMNRNLAGSWAPSSTRSGTGAREVIEYQEGDPRGQVNLRADHAQRAFDYLLSGQPLPVLPWALWWLRDYGFSATESAAPGAALVIRAFRSIFELNATPQTQALGAAEDFDLLFSQPAPADIKSPLFEDSTS